MKFRINTIDKNEFDVITEDGGIASIYESDNCFQTMYYQTRLTEISEDVHTEVWDDLSEGKAYLKEWDGDPSVEELIQDALEWLVFPQPDKWERDDTIFQNVIIN